MKIALVTDVIYPFTIGGSEIRNYEVAKRLVKMGHEVHIFGAKLWEGDKNDFKIDGIKVHGVSKYERLYKRNGRRSVLDPVFLAIKIALRLSKEDFDVIDVTAFTFFNCYAVKIVSLFKKTPLVLTWQQYFGDYLTGYFGPIMGLIGRIMERNSVLLTKNHLAVSNFVKSELMRRGVKEKNIKVVYNGADVELINKIPDQQKIYDLIFVGRLNYQKNLPLLIESAFLLKKTMPKIKVAIVGQGEEENLKNLIKQKNLEGNFDFLGVITQKEKLFKTIKSARIFVLPSILEGFPLTVVEANACGLPVVATKTNHNNIDEYVKDSENGILTEPASNKFANSIHCLLKDNELFKLMSKKSASAAAIFDWNKIAVRQEKYYKESL